MTQARAFANGGLSPGWWAWSQATCCSDRAVAVPLFLLLWLVLRARQGWAAAIAVAAPAALLIGFLLPWGLAIRLPPGIIGTVLLP